MGSGGQDPAGSVADGVAWSPSSIQPVDEVEFATQNAQKNKTPEVKVMSIQVRLRRHPGCLCFQRRRRTPPASEL